MNLNRPAYEWGMFQKSSDEEWITHKILMNVYRQILESGSNREYFSAHSCAYACAKH